MGTQLPFPWSWADSVQRAYTAAVQLVTLDDVGGKLHLSPLHAVCICLITQFYMGYYSFIDSGRMKGWVGLVGWPIADSLPTKWSPVQLLVRRRSGRTEEVKDQRSTTLLYAAIYLMYVIKRRVVNSFCWLVMSVRCSTTTPVTRRSHSVRSQLRQNTRRKWHYCCISPSTCTRTCQPAAT